MKTDKELMDQVLDHIISLCDKKDMDDLYGKPEGHTEVIIEGKMPEGEEHFADGGETCEHCGQEKEMGHECDGHPTEPTTELEKEVSLPNLMDDSDENETEDDNNDDLPVFGRMNKKLRW